MDLVVANISGAALLPIAGDAVPHLPERGQRLDVDVDQVSRSLPFVPLERWFGFQNPETAKGQRAEGSGDSRERGVELPGDVTQVQALVPETHGALQLLRIEHPPLGVCRKTMLLSGFPPLLPSWSWRDVRSDRSASLCGHDRLDGALG
jgi:hypothetical protein